MMFWFAALLILCGALFVLAWPFIAGRQAGPSRQDSGMEVYRQQLAEIESDVRRGVLDRSEAGPMELEIKRRLLKMARDKDAGPGAKTAAGRVALVALLLIVPAASLGLYLELGSPDQPSRPLASRDIDAERARLARQDPGNIIRQLIESLQAQPDNIDGWILLARNLSEIERYKEAAETFLKATVLSPQDAGLYVGAGENYYFAAGGIVDAEAAKAFETALSLDPDHPGARYYLALRDAQAGKMEEALNSWIALYRDSPADAPYLSVLSRRIEETAAETGTDLGDLLTAKAPAPGPSRVDMEAAQNMSAEERQQMIASMVERLADRMTETPDYDGLMRLGQVYATIRNYAGSADAYARALSLRPDDDAAMAAEAFAHIQAAGDQSQPPARSIELYRALLEKNNLVPEALWYVGVAEAQAGNDVEALRLWRLLQQRAAAKSPLQETVTKAINSLSGRVKN